MVKYIVLVLGLLIRLEVRSYDEIRTITNISILLDWSQTRHMSRNYKEKQLKEISPILGKLPNQDEIDIYFASSLIAYNYVANNHSNSK